MLTPTQLRAEFVSPSKIFQRIDCLGVGSFVCVPVARSLGLYVGWCGGGSVAKSRLTLQPHGLQHARLPCPSPSPIACSNAYPLSRRCHPTILSAVIPFLILSEGNWDSHKEFTFWNTATYPQPGTYQECGEAAHLEVSREKDQEEQGEAPP